MIDIDPTSPLAQMRSPPASGCYRSSSHPEASMPRIALRQTSVELNCDAFKDVLDSRIESFKEEREGLITQYRLGGEKYIR
jgi:hypothetical protein